jgi:2-octaprenyl-6-methoxyphenol hydroxylase
LRDAWELAEEIIACEPEWLGQDDMLERVRRRRQIDRVASIRFTDSLVRVFSNDVPPLRIARGLGLAALDQLPILKTFLARRMTFGARG